MSFRFAFVLPALLATVHCSGSTVSSGADAAPSTTDAGDAGPAREPKLHREQSSACTAPRPAGPNPSGTGGACTSDAECTAGKNGRCVYGPSFTAVCSYDECTTDQDCSAGVCDCRNETKRFANACFRGNCVTDADCGGRYCSPSGTSLFDNCHRNVPPGSFGYFCHTPTDACIDDADCGEGSTCLFSPDSQRWTCLVRVCTK